ncbi:hypothetical protein N9D80_01340 [Flavobacteriales bacterium]|nr:hypothetical protein [Flavobacteriales bacterium]
MAINFLQNVDLNKGEIQNVALQNAGTNPGTPATGQIYFNTGDSTLRVYNGTSWDIYSTTTGDITSVIAGDGLIGGGTSGDVTLNVNVDSSSIEINLDALRVKALGITNAMLAGSIENSKLLNSSITLTQGAGMAALGSVSLGGSITVAVDGVLEDLDTLGAPASDGQMIVATGAGAFQYESGATLRASIGVDPAGTDNSTNVTLVTTSHDYLSIAGQAITLGTIENNDLANSSITIDGTSVSLGGSVTTDNDDVSNANLLTALANLESSGGAANENIVIGTDSGDTIVITGNLQVSGTTTTVNSETVNIADNNIVLDSNNTTSAPIDGAGITIEGGTGDDVTFAWSTSALAFEIKRGSNYAGLITGSINTDAIRLDGTNITSTAAELNKLDGYTGSVTELNYLDTLHATGVTSTEFDYLDGVTSNIQTQLNAKAASGHAADVGGSTSVAITHPLNTRDVNVQLYDKTTFETVYADVVRTSGTVVTFNFRTAPAAAAYRCVITRI